MIIKLSRYADHNAGRIREALVDDTAWEPMNSYPVMLVSPIDTARLLMLRSAVAAVAAAMLSGTVVARAFTPGHLLVSRSVYTATAGLIVVGQPLPGGGLAVANGSYPGVWANEAVDASFGVTSPIIIDEITSSGALVSSMNVTDALAASGTPFVTSFPSKSELGLSLSADGSAVTFMAYQAPVNALDVSNSNTPGHVDPTNPVGTWPVNQGPSSRGVIDLDLSGNVIATPVNAYSGNNGRGAILGSTGYYYMVGNAGNGGNITIKGVNATPGSATLTITGNGNSTALLEPGQPIGGGTIPANAVVVSITDATHFTISAAPAASSVSSFNATITQNGTVLSALSDNTGLQMVAPGAGSESIVVGQVNGTFGSATGYQRGFAMMLTDPVTGQPYGAADKTGKDDNFRGITIFNNTLYVTKGSGGNGIDTVYEVGIAGRLPRPTDAAATPITIVPGFPTMPARNLSSVDSTTTSNGRYNTSFSGTDTEFFPFGIWFADQNTLYVADEGAPITTSGSKAVSVALAALDPHAGLQKWSLVNGAWRLDYTLQAGLDLGAQYAVANGLNGEVYPAAMSPATAGLRNLTGRLNGDGTVTVYAVTSTASTATDQGADPNKLVAITDTLAFTTPAQAAGERFLTLRSAGYGEVLRGVALAGPFDLSMSGFVRDRRAQTYAQQITVQNISSSSVPGPLVVVLDGLSANATLSNGSGITTNQPPLGRSYIVVPGTQQGLSPGASASVVAQFVDPTIAAITFTPRVVAGTATP